MSDHDDEEGDDPLEQLTALGYSGGEAVDALMQCHGNVTKAAEYLSGSRSAIDNNGAASSEKKTQKGKKARKQGAASKDSLKNEKETKGLTFQERRKLEIEQRKAKRDSKKVCRVCGGPHPQRECPGIIDGGRGQSRWNDPAARLKDRHQRKEHKQQQQQVREKNSLGTWTEAVPYMDGFADLHAVFTGTNASGGDIKLQKGTTDTKALSPFAQYIQQWASLQVELGNSTPLRNKTVQKQQLKALRVRVLRDKALEVILKDGYEEETAQAVVDAAMESGNPQSELIKIILAAPEDLPQKRTILTEWPGYRGCLTPFSVMDSEAVDTLKTLKEYRNNVGVRALLALPPGEVVKWMVVESIPGGATSTGELGSDPLSIDIPAVIRMADEVDRTKSELISAQKELLASRNKKTKVKAEQKVERLGKLLASQRERNAEASSGGMPAASTARLSQQVGESLDYAIDKYTNQNVSVAAGTSKLVVGVSCGLDYRTTEAMHPSTGGAVRRAQREACKLAVEAAAKANLPIVLECHNAPSGASNNTKQEHVEGEEEVRDESASAELVRILATCAVPSDATMLLRSGSLTVESQPGLLKLLDAFPHLFIGFSSSLSYAKCPKELLDIAYDVPIERLILTSEAPTSLPAALGGAKQEEQCVPPHVACAAEAIARIKSGAVEMESDIVLRTSTLNLCNAFGLSVPSTSPVETVAVDNKNDG